MPAYKTVIIDEDSSARRQLVDLLSERPDVEIIGQYKNGLEAIKAINTHQPELIFLEIEMPDISGFEVLENIESTLSPFVVFTSENGDHAVQAFEVEALDYIRKPYDKARVEKSLGRMKRRSNTNIREALNGTLGRIIPDFKDRKTRSLKRFIIKQGGEYHLIRTKDIIWIESDGNYSRIVTQEKKFMVRYTLSGFEEQLDSRQFFRISRSQIVNVDFVIKIKDHVYGNYLIELQSGASLKMSKNYKHLFEALKNF